MYPEQFIVPSVEQPSSPTVGIIVGVIALIGVGAALFGAKIWYDKRRLGNQPPRSSAYAMKDDDEKSPAKD